MFSVGKKNPLSPISFAIDLCFLPSLCPTGQEGTVLTEGNIHQEVDRQQKEDNVGDNGIQK
jgi:hypothetical protein